MITPAPTSKIDPKLCRGILESEIPASATAPAQIVIAIPDTSYQIHLSPETEVSTRPGQRIVGRIQLSARRIDVVQSGGRFVEPVFGRPRRVQGPIIAVEADSLVVNAGVPIWVRPTDPRQTADGFQVGQFVAFDAMDDARFQARP